MKRKTMSTVVCLMLVITALAIVPLNGCAVTDEEIEQSIADGINWLLDQQNTDGSWGSSDLVAHTAFVLIKLQDRAYELEMNPFQTNANQTGFCPWAVNIIHGWEYIFGFASKQTPLPLNLYGDNPDTNGNEYGVYFSSNSGHPTYTTGLVLMALSSSQTPDRPNEVGFDFNGDNQSDTYGEIAQECVDWFAWSQLDIPDPGGRGGWRYEPTDDWADNSNSGYAVLGLAAAQDFGCTVPDFVKKELNYWIDYIQNDVDGDPNDGGSGYTTPDDGWVNEFKTGNLIFQMTFVGDTPSTGRFQNASDYIVRHWQDENWDPGWGFNLTQAHYQAMYCLMKGLTYSDVDLIDLNNDGTPEHDWYQEFATVLVTQQNLDGSWSSDYWGNSILSTVWALLTLEKIAPIPPPRCDGWWTGGGTIGTNRNPRVTHGFEIHCNVEQLPNNLEVNWAGYKFHLDVLTKVECSDDPAINPNPPHAGCDTIHGWGDGHYNGMSGYHVEFIFTDAGEPGKVDWAWIVITDLDGDTVMEVSGFLKSGNQQAHSHTTMLDLFDTPLTQIWERLQERFPNTFPLLRQLLGY